MTIKLPGIIIYKFNFECRYLLTISQIHSTFFFNDSVLIIQMSDMLSNPAVFRGPQFHVCFAAFERPISNIIDPEQPLGVVIVKT